MTNRETVCMTDESCEEPITPIFAFCDHQRPQISDTHGDVQDTGKLTGHIHMNLGEYYDKKEHSSHELV